MIVDTNSFPFNIHIRSYSYTLLNSLVWHEGFYVASVSDRTRIMFSLLTKLGFYLSSVVMDFRAVTRRDI